jgi:hypothetical protein
MMLSPISTTYGCHQTKKITDSNTEIIRQN